MDTPVADAQPLSRRLCTALWALPSPGVPSAVSEQQQRYQRGRTTSQILESRRTDLLIKMELHLSGRHRYSSLTATHAAMQGGWITEVQQVLLHPG